jgi:hypothetical protein
VGAGLGLSEHRGMKTIAATLIALSLALPAAGHADPAPRPPHILEFEYSEDYERIGRHHNAYATLNGDAERVTARVAGVLTAGKLDDARGLKAYWNFRDRDFMRALLADLHDDGEATVKVKAVGAGRTVRKACTLVLEPDEGYGEYAGGECRRV